MRKILLGLSQLFFLLIIACGIKGQDFDQMVNNLIDTSVPLIYPDSLFLKLKSESNIVVLDAREKEEYNISHLENAIWVGYKEFELEDLKIGTNKEVVVYCSVGYRSEKVGEKLVDAGFNSVYNLHGGIFGWVNSEYPVVDGQEKTTTKIHPYSNSWGKWLTKGEKVYE
jgi:rhodanese-related sulfurtransferase